MNFKAIGQVSGCQLPSGNFYTVPDGQDLFGSVPKNNYKGTPIPWNGTGCHATIVGGNLGVCYVNHTQLGNEYKINIVGCSLDNDYVFLILSSGLIGVAIRKKYLRFILVQNK